MATVMVTITTPANTWRLLDMLIHTTQRLRQRRRHTNSMSRCRPRLRQRQHRRRHRRQRRSGHPTRQPALGPASIRLLPHPMDNPDRRHPDPRPRHVAHLHALPLQPTRRRQQCTNRTMPSTPPLSLQCPRHRPLPSQRSCTRRRQLRPCQPCQRPCLPWCRRLAVVLAGRTVTAIATAPASRRHRRPHAVAVDRALPLPMALLVTATVAQPVRPTRRHTPTAS